MIDKMSIRLEPATHVCVCRCVFCILCHTNQEFRSSLFLVSSIDFSIYINSRLYRYIYILKYTGFVVMYGHNIISLSITIQVFSLMGVVAKVNMRARASRYIPTRWTNAFDIKDCVSYEHIVSVAGPFWW